VSTSRSERIDLLADPSSVGEARRFVRRVLVSWHVEQAVDVVTLLVSELATNAVLHARTAYSVVMSRSDTSVRVEVLDGSGVAPRQRQNSTTAATGRGVALVDRLSSAWGTHNDQQGFSKGVWFTVPLTGVEDSVWFDDP
jgi:anti-sigma regulatory factor (Ser/Thr protein kinase)